MRKLIVSTFLTLDGVMQAPGGPEEDDERRLHPRRLVGELLGRQMGQVMGEAMSRPFDLLLGRKTYDIFAAFWPHTDDPGARPLNDATKYVASRSRPALEWSNSVLLEGDAADGSRGAEGRETGRNCRCTAAANLIQTLMRHGLVDEYRLWVFPVVIGSGKRLFADGTVPAGLKLVDSTISTTGVVIGTYEPAGEMVTGSFAPE